MSRFARLSPATWRRIGLPLGALALQIVLLKAIKLQLVVYPEGEGLDVQCVSDTDAAFTLVRTHAPPLLLPLLAGALVAVRLGSRGVSAGRRALAAGAAALGVLLLLRVVLPEPPTWLSADLLRVLRSDLLLLVALTAGFAVAVEHARGVLRPLTQGLLYLTVALLMTLISLDFGYFVITGSLADAYLLRYAIKHATDLSWVFGHELHGTNALVLALPVAVVAVAATVERRSRHATATVAAPGLGWLAVLALLLLLIPRAGSPSAPAVLAVSTPVELIAELLRPSPWEARAATLDPGTAPPLFDTRRLRLAATADARPRNVVVVVLESQRAHVPAGVTPFLDRVSRQALVADEMYALVPHTNRELVTILCGVPPRIAQGYATEVPGNCLPALLRPQGFVSAFFTTATLDFESKGELLRAMGYDETHGAELYEGGRFEREGYFGFEDRALLEPTLAWVDRQHAAGKPFLLTILTLASHHPYVLPSTATRRALTGQTRRDSYLSALAYVDGVIGQLWAGFESRGLLDSTLFVFTGDHGEAFGEHGLSFHSAVIWDEGLHVPAVFANPVLFPSQRRVAGPRDHTDLVPTIAELLGFRLEDGVVQGASLLAPVSPERTLHHATWIDNQSMALRKGSRKWVYHYRRLPMQLYDLAKDPHEQHDLGAELTPADTDAVELELLRWRRQVNAAHG